MDLKVKFSVQGAQQPNLPEGVDKQPMLESGGGQLVSQQFPETSHIVSKGASFWWKSAAVTPVTAIPTIAYLTALYNGELENGKSYIIDSLFLHVIAVTAAIQSCGIIANLATAPWTAPAASVTPRPLLGGSRINSRAIIPAAANMDATNGVAANWQPIGPGTVPQNTLQIGSGVDWDAKGRIVIPPKHALALSVLAGAATATSVQIGGRWHERILPAAV